MKPLMQHQRDGLVFLNRMLGRRLARLSEVLSAEPEAGSPKYVRQNWQREIQVAEAACGAMPAHKMGLGKTAVGVRFCRVLPQWAETWKEAGTLHPVLYERLRDPRILILVRRSDHRYHWEAEWEKWRLEGETGDILSVDSNKDDFVFQMMAMALGVARVCVMPYTTMRARIDDGLLAIPWDVVIYDEIQALGNPAAQWTQAAYRLSDIPLLRVALSGTPYTNKVNRLWSGLALLQGWTAERRDTYTDEVLGHLRRSDIWDSKQEFERMYCETTTGRGGTRVVGGKNLSMDTCTLPCCRSRYARGPDGLYAWSAPVKDESKCMSLNARLKREVMHRVDTADVLDLPPWRIVDVAVDMTKTQQRVYQQLLRGLLNWTDIEGHNGSVSVTNVMAQMTYGFTLCADLRQLLTGVAKKRASTSESIADLGNITARMLAAVPPEECSGKLDWLLDFVENDLNGDKVVVFTRFAVTARTIHDTLNRAGYKTVIMEGKTKPEERRAAEQAFLNDDNVTVCVCTEVGGEGVNLHSASYVVLFGFVSWNSEDIEQRIGRAYGRLADPHSVVVYRLFHQRTVEVFLNQVVGSKARDASEALDGGSDAARAVAARLGGRFVSVDTVRDIFEGRV